jgi:polyhydroxyalkanoate synthesis regulator phasin
MKTLAVIILATALNAQAQAPTETVKPQEKGSQKREEIVKNREERQEKRIQEGVKKGKLSAEEAKKLEGKEEEIKKMAAAAEADGKMTKKEFKEIKKAQNEVSGEIAKKKHNKVK